MPCAHELCHGWNRRGQIHDCIVTLERRRQRGSVEDRDRERVRPQLSQRLRLLLRGGHRSNCVSFPHQSSNGMATNCTGSARNEYSHLNLRNSKDGG